MTAEVASKAAAKADLQDGCLFCRETDDRVIAQNELAYASLDRYPASQGHTLIIPRRHAETYFELNQAEVLAIHKLLHQAKEVLLAEDTSITGFNIGMNCGASAGQSIWHCHVHLIPRRLGDTADPRGGVRGVIPAKQSY